MSFSENLKIIRAKKKYTQEKTAQNLEIDRTTYNKYESGKSEPDFKMLCKIAKLFNVSIDYLLDIESQSQSVLNPEEEKVVSLYKNVGSPFKKIVLYTLETGQLKRSIPMRHSDEIADSLCPDNLIKTGGLIIPVVGRAAAGLPIEMIQDYDASLEISDNKIMPGDFAVIADGDSMINAGINPGDRVIIRPQAVVENGELALIAVEDGSTIKRFFKQKEWVLLVSENDKYPPQKYSEGSNIRVLGKVVKVADSFREHCNNQDFK